MAKNTDFKKETINLEFIKDSDNTNANFNYAYRTISTLRKKAKEFGSVDFVFMTKDSASNKVTSHTSGCIIFNKKTNQTVATHSPASDEVPYTWAELIRAIVPTKDTKVKVHSVTPSMEAYAASVMINAIKHM